MALAIQTVSGTPPLPLTIAIGGVMGLFGVWFMRPLYLEFGPVRTLYDRVFKWLSFRTAPGEGAA
jgi:hypothetical protein